MSTGYMRRINREFSRVKFLQEEVTLFSGERSHFLAGTLKIHAPFAV